MCGIVGQMYFSDNARQVDPVLLARMRDTMAHRGPDGSGLWLSEDRKVGLAHRRLAIIDLSDAAAQPMRDGELVVTFNGEIYNHVALRQELERLGVGAWQTDHSDTEVILKAYRAWGIDCVHRFRGMFAFALWDGGQRLLRLVRDRIGVKPLYYSSHPDRFAFASEIKALLEDPGQPREVNERGFFNYLSFLTVPAPETLFEGIRKLQAGSIATVHPDGRFEARRYWDPLDAGGEGAPLRDPCGAIRRLLEESVRLRSVSDVPVGIFLSGGIDSSTNAALFAGLSQAPIKTFSIGYDGDYASYRSELAFAKMAAEHVGADHKERLLDQQDLIRFLPRMIWHQDEPIADPVCVPVFYVSELARASGVTVCQVGEGSDELFGGYANWMKLMRLQHWSSLPLARGMSGAGARVLELLNRDRGRPFEWLLRSSRGIPLFWSGAEALTHRRKLRLLSPRLRESFASRWSWEEILPLWNDYRSRVDRFQPLQWMGYVDLRLRLPELLLMRVDKMSMATSVEARVPFLDHQLVEAAMGIPDAVKVPGYRPKALLKEAVRGLIPDAIIDRPKQGFGVPVSEWFRDRLGDFTKRAVIRLCKDSDLLDRDAAAAAVSAGDSGQSWILCNLALWHATFIQREPEALIES